MQAVKDIDKRIHFALNCGAKSCPPIKLFSPDTLEEGLQSAAASFCQGVRSLDFVDLLSSVLSNQLIRLSRNDSSYHYRRLASGILCNSPFMSCFLRFFSDLGNPNLSSWQIHPRYGGQHLLNQ